MSRSVSTFAQATIVLAFAGLFYSVVAVALPRLRTFDNDASLEELDLTVLRRVEIAINSTDAVLKAVIHDKLTDCGGSTLQNLRQRVYQNNMIKDIRIVDPEDNSVRCSAHTETLEFDQSWAQPTDMLSTADAALSVFRIERTAGDALGVLRAADATTSVAAIVGIDASQFDVLPRELRDSGTIEVVFDNGGRIATSTSRAGPQPMGSVYSHHSDHLPLATRVIIYGDVVASWNTEASLGWLCVATVFGLLFGLLAARLLVRPTDPLADIDSGIANCEFHPFFQPIFSLQTREIIGCEMLMRRVQSDGKVIGPSAFIALAESSGRIDAMTWLMLDKALVHLRPLMHDRPTFKASLNIVPRHLLAEGFVTRLSAQVSARGVDPAQIVVEITERDELQDLERGAKAIASLKRAGFRVAIDDVGVGHSGLSYIQRLRADTIKIDKFFIDAVGLDNTASAVVGMLVRLARELGMTVVAEGIETEQQFDALRALDVDQGQGYLVAPPLSASAFLAIVEQGPSRSSVAVTKMSPLATAA